MQRANGVIRDTLRANTSGRKDDWDSHLTLAELAINNTASTIGDGLTPFFIDHGEHSRLPPSPPHHDRTTGESPAHYAQQMQQMTATARELLAAAQAEVKAKLVAGRVDTVLQVGDRVLLRAKEFSTPLTSASCAHGGTVPSLCSSARAPTPTPSRCRVEGRHAQPPPAAAPPSPAAAAAPPAAPPLVVAPDTHSFRMPIFDKAAIGPVPLAWLRLDPWDAGPAWCSPGLLARGSARALGAAVVGSPLGSAWHGPGRRWVLMCHARLSYRRLSGTTVHGQTEGTSKQCSGMACSDNLACAGLRPAWPRSCLEVAGPPTQSESLALAAVALDAAPSVIRARGRRIGVGVSGDSESESGLERST